jgi:hypothetical protein
MAKTTISVDITDNAAKRGNVKNVSANRVGGKWSIERELENIKQYHINTAKDVLAEELRNGFDKDYRRFVDGSQGKPEESVRNFGKIQYEARADISAAIIEAYEQILKYSPRVTGTYMSANWVLFRGRIVAKTYSELFRWANTQLSGINIKKGDKIRFYNAAPYARRLENKGISANNELGTKQSDPKKRRFKSGGIRVTGAKANGAYALATAIIRNKYRFGIGAKSIRYEALPLNYIGQGVSALSMKGRQPGGSNWSQTFKTKGWSGFYLHPTLTITF